MNENAINEPLIVSRETNHAERRQNFIDNCTMMEQVRRHYAVRAQHAAQKSFATGPKPPQWILDLEQEQEAIALAEEQKLRRDRDGVEKISLEELMALDINDYAPDKS